MRPLPALIAEADVMVLPTVSEGLANVWVEALACGVPVVTSDVGGARDVIDRPEAGRLVPREPKAIAAAVRELLAAPPDRAEVRKAAEKFSWERNGAELAAHLQALVARAASALQRSCGPRRAAGPRRGRRHGCPSPRRRSRVSRAPG